MLVEVGFSAPARSLTTAPPNLSPPSTGVRSLSLLRLTLPRCRRTDPLAIFEKARYIVACKVTVHI